MSEYKFQKFTKTGARLSNYSISFNKSGFFGFNSGFYLKENIKNFSKVILFFDNKKKAVGLKFTNDQKADGVFTIVHAKNQSTGSVTARSFMISNELNKPIYYGKRTPVIVTDDNFGELYVINLLEN